MPVCSTTGQPCGSARFSSFTQRNSGGVHTYDEIRFGATYEDVIGQGGSPGGNTFADWIAGYEVDGLAGFDDDFDRDGIGNGLENYFGTDPDVFSSGLVAGVAAGGTFTFSHPLAEGPADDVSAVYLWSADLASFHADGATFNGTTVTFAKGTPVDGLVEVTATITGTPTGRLFVVVEAVQE